MKPSWAVRKLTELVGPRPPKMSSDPAIREASLATPELELLAESANQKLSYGISIRIVPFSPGIWKMT